MRTSAAAEVVSQTELKSIGKGRDQTWLTLTSSESNQIKEPAHKT